MKPNARVQVQCPECNGTLLVTVSPAYPMRTYRGGCNGCADPPEPAEIQDIEAIVIDKELACPHVDALWESDAFYDSVLMELAERDEAAYEREMDSRYEREQGRGEE